MVEERARAVNGVQTVWEDAHLRLAAVATDVLGMAGRRSLHAIVAGESDPQLLAALATGERQGKRTAWEQALSGRVRAHHRLLLRALLAQVDDREEAITRVSTAITTALQPFAAALALLYSIAGSTQRAAAVILAQLGTAMGVWPSARHRCAWAALGPGNHESAGRPRRGRTRHGNRGLKGGSLQAAWAATGVKDGYLGARLRRLARGRGEKGAVGAVAHSILTIIDHVLQTGQPSRAVGAGCFDRLEPRKLARYHLRRRAELGEEVPFVPPPAA